MIIRHSQNDFAMAMLAKTATRGITIIPLPSSEHISTNPKVVLRYSMENGGTSNDGIPGSTLPESRNGISDGLTQLYEIADVMNTINAFRDMLMYHKPFLIELTTRLLFNGMGISLRR